MNNPDELLTAVDVIRCVWLARTAAKRGDDQSTRRWQAKADAWLERVQSAAQLLNVDLNPWTVREGWVALTSFKIAASLIGLLGFKPVKTRSSVSLLKTGGILITVS